MAEIKLVDVDMSREIWLPVKTNKEDYTGFYEVSNYGNIRSIDRYINHNYGGDRICKGKILKKAKDNRGYYRRLLSKNGKQESRGIHQLVVKSFNPDLIIPEGYSIDHINRNPLDNRYDNFRVVTFRENTQNRSDFNGYSINKNNDYIAKIFIDKNDVYLLTTNKEYIAKKAYELALLNINKYNGDNLHFRNIVKMELMKYYKDLNIFKSAVQKRKRNRPFYTQLSFESKGIVFSKSFYTKEETQKFYLFCKFNEHLMENKQQYKEYCLNNYQKFFSEIGM